jgi:hypothetical protein
MHQSNFKGYNTGEQNKALYGSNLYEVVGVSLEGIQLLLDLRSCLSVGLNSISFRHSFRCHSENSKFRLGTNQYNLTLFFKNEKVHRYNVVSSNLCFLQ